jgi:hypothetical protein
MFKIGQKVVCKNSIQTFPKLVSNKIYTVRSIHKCTNCGDTCLELEEIISTYISRGTICSNCNQLYFPDEIQYRASRFEPLKYDLLDNKDIISELIEERADIKIPELVEN